MTIEKNYVILAPHIDDELIGCYRFLKENTVKRVFYFFELTEERRNEARNTSTLFYFDPVFDFIPVSIATFEPPNTIFLVPNIHDEHPDHKDVNNFAKKYLSKFKLEFYSIDMNVDKDLLTVKEREEKKDLLYKLYPSQSKLFENEKYHLFESHLDSDTKKMIWVTFQKEGIHSYPEALTDPYLSDVKFLGYPHRHIFHFKVYIEVFNNNRDLEFIMFKRWLESLFEEKTINHNNKSCEMISDDLASAIRNKYPKRKMKIEVSEDGENGSIIEYEN